MNKNLPSVEAIVREVLAGDVADAAAAIAHRLNGARLLVDPERSYGLIFRREAGVWSREPRTETELESQALAWDAACGRAAGLAERIRSECGEGRGLMRVQVQGDRLLVSVQITNPAQWGQWRTYLGITRDEPGAPTYAYVGAGHRDGVAVSVVAYDGPQVEARTAAAARMPHRHGGVVYDLALPLRDAAGDIWVYQETRTDGMPLLVQRGAQVEARCTLAQVVHWAGPLTAVHEPVQAPVQGGGA